MVSLILAIHVKLRSVCMNQKLFFEWRAAGSQVAAPPDFTFPRRKTQLWLKDPFRTGCWPPSFLPKGWECTHIIAWSLVATVHGGGGGGGWPLSLILLFDQGLFSSPDCHTPITRLSGGTYTNNVCILFHRLLMCTNTWLLLNHHTVWVQHCAAVCMTAHARKHIPLRCIHNTNRQIHTHGLGQLSLSGHCTDDHYLCTPKPVCGSCSHTVPTEDVAVNFIFTGNLIGNGLIVWMLLEEEETNSHHSWGNSQLKEVVAGNNKSFKDLSFYSYVTMNYGLTFNQTVMFCIHPLRWNWSLWFHRLLSSKDRPV